MGGILSRTIKNIQLIKRSSWFQNNNTTLNGIPLVKPNVWYDAVVRNHTNTLEITVLSRNS